MGLKREFSETLNAIRLVLSIRKYKVISLIFGLVIFGFLYYFLVAKVASNDIWISVMMSGPAFVTWSIISILTTSVLSGTLFSMLLFKYQLYNKIEGKGILGFIGSGVAAFGVGCPTCGAFLFGLIGMPLVLIYLPFRGLELQVLGILILLGSIYFTGKSIKGVCRIQ